MYKYRIWEDLWHQRILTEREVYFAHPDMLNDPEDCNRLVRYDLLKPEEQREWVRNGLRKLHSKWNALAIAREADRVLSRPHFDLKKLGSDRLREIRSKIGVFSVSEHRDIPDQWEDYANSHKGFCVGFNTMIVREISQSTVGFVQYLPSPLPDLAPSLDPENGFLFDIIKQTYVKTRRWQVEAEIRFRKLPIASNGQRAVRLPPKAFREVILGKNISAEHEKEIRQILSDPTLTHVEVTKH